MLQAPCYKHAFYMELTCSVFVCGPPDMPGSGPFTGIENKTFFSAVKTVWLSLLVLHGAFRWSSKTSNLNISLWTAWSKKWWCQQCTAMPEHRRFFSNLRLTIVASNDMSKLKIKVKSISVIFLGLVLVIVVMAKSAYLHCFAKCSSGSGRSSTPRVHDQCFAFGTETSIHNLYL